MSMTLLLFPYCSDDPYNFPSLLCNRPNCLGYPTWAGTWSEGKWEIDCYNMDCAIARASEENSK